MNVQEIYICSECNVRYDSYQEAEECCPTEIDEVYSCGECGQEFDDFKPAAGCCVEEGELLVLPQQVAKVLHKKRDLSVVKFCSSEFGLLKDKETVITWATEAAARQYISLM